MFSINLMLKKSISYYDLAYIKIMNNLLNDFFMTWANA